MANIPTAKANHLTSWRSILLVRIRRTNNDAAAVSARAYEIVSTGFMTLAATSMPRGLVTESNHHYFVSCHSKCVSYPNVTYNRNRSSGELTPARVYRLKKR